MKNLYFFALLTFLCVRAHAQSDTTLNSLYDTKGLITQFKVSDTLSNLYTYEYPSNFNGGYPIVSQKIGECEIKIKSVFKPGENVFWNAKQLQVVNSEEYYGLFKAVILGDCIYLLCKDQNGVLWYLPETDLKKIP